ncbi:hypothetical protein [Mucilaginibacter flavus]|uniref:hypothetical protein n=1 Tax=Mucilaginibacter flavus TaxID=931504 RepID=UPI0025B32852|nr:hypothetical protein [Mucilaginibacter flavus]MDN3584374.1 hypothetical protein [Mucilaginibacter flavus]
MADASGLLDVGHSAIQLNDNYVFGYYPSSSSGHGFGSGDLMSSKGAPSVVSRSTFDREYLKQGYTEYTLSITAKQFSSLQNYLSNVVNNPGNYSLFLNNCTSVIITGLQNEGIYLRIHGLGTTGEIITPAFTKPAQFGNALNEAYYAMPSLVTKFNHYGGN